MGTAIESIPPPYTLHAATRLVAIPSSMETIMFRELINGFSQRVRLENSIQLQKAKLIRPKQVKLEIAHVFKDITDQLNGDPVLKAEYDSINLELPA